MLLPRRFRPRFALNPMMFKELTQGIRNMGFVLLFFLLLLLSWIVLVWVMVLAESGSNVDGHNSAIALIFCLYLFGLVVGGRAYGLTVKEVENKTFELYLLAGMSPERLVMGKISTCLYLFLFGFFTVVPFVFSSYFLSGLDFLLMLVVVGLLLLCLISFYFTSILVAFIRSLTSARTIVSLAYYLLILFLGFLGFTFFIVQDRGSLTSMALAVRTSFGIYGGSWEFLAQLGAAYIVFLVLSFYWSCHLVCPESDSREHILKFIIVLLLMVLFWIDVSVGSSDVSDFLAFVYSLCVLGLGLFFWVNREEVPIIQAVRRAGGGPFRRVFYYFFEPGVRGTSVLLIALSLVAVGFAMLEDRLHDSIWVMTPIFMFQLGLWSAVFRRIPALRRKPAYMRGTLIFFWGGVSLVAWMLHIFLNPHAVTLSYPVPVLLLLGGLVSPFMTPAVLASRNIAPENLLMMAWACWILGTYLMIRRNQILPPSAIDDDAAQKRHLEQSPASTAAVPVGATE